MFGSLFTCYTETGVRDTRFVVLGVVAQSSGGTCSSPVRFCLFFEADDRQCVGIRFSSSQLIDSMSDCIIISSS